MKQLILALFACLLAHALDARAVAQTPAAAVPVQEKPASPPPAAAEVQEAEKLGASVKQLYAAGEYRAALPQAQRLLALLEKLRGEEDPLVGNALNNVAVLHIALNEFGRAAPILERILVRREKSKAASSPTTTHLLISYGCLIRARGVGQRGQVMKLDERVNSIFLQDAVLAAGLALPANLSELGGGNVVSKPQPRYPREALSARIQGSVLVLAEADETGKVVSVEPVPCWGGQKSLAAAAAEAMRAARFKPLLVNGRGVRFKAIAAYNFVIQ
jgi:TonB family protein